VSLSYGYLENDPATLLLEFMEGKKHPHLQKSEGQLQKGNPGLVGRGGIIRDHNGDWILAYAGRLGTQSNNVAESRALLWGVSLAKEKEIKHILIEGDSLLILNAI
ncbi:hypothetical protein KI387_006650, partial [Taxus chinensis]